MQIVDRTREYQLISHSTEQYIAETAFDIFTAPYLNFLPDDDPRVEILRKIGMRIIKCSGSEELNSLNWEFRIADTDTLLALGRPGGMIMISTSMMESIKDENELANVIGHEIGHILSHHLGANVSQLSLFFVFNVACDVFLKTGFILPPLFELLWNIPFWKNSEIEADFVGLVLMSRALYDFRVAPKFFERMVAEEKKYNTTLGFVRLHMSTWPSSEQRLLVLKKWQEIARRHYIQSKMGMSQTKKDDNDKSK